MKIFIDSADLDQIREAFSWGIVDGITTNPSLIKKAVEKTKASGENISLEDYICRVLETAGDAPVSLEVIGTTEEEMTAQGRFLFRPLQSRRSQRRREDPREPGLRAELRASLGRAQVDPHARERGHPDQHDADLHARAGDARGEGRRRRTSRRSPGASTTTSGRRRALPGGKSDYFPSAGSRRTASPSTTAASRRASSSSARSSRCSRTITSSARSSPRASATRARCASARSRARTSRRSRSRSCARCSSTTRPSRA